MQKQLHEDGHWVVNYDDSLDCVGVVCLNQDTDTYGVSLLVQGVFESNLEKVEYCSLLCSVLNREYINIPSTELETTDNSHIFRLKNGVYHDVWDNRVHVGNYAWFDEVQQFAGVTDTYEEAVKAMNAYCSHMLEQ